MKDQKNIMHRRKWVRPLVKALLDGFTGLAFLAALLLPCGVVYEHGFHISAAESHALSVLYFWVWIIFLTNNTLHIALRYKDTRQAYSALTWMLAALLYLTLVPYIFNRPDEDGGVLWLWNFLAGKGYRLTVMMVISFFTLSKNFIEVLGRRTNPSLLLAVSFMIIILIGSGLLMLPRCTVGGISWVDSLFMSTSAVCVTGLSPIDIPSTFTTAGFVILIVLVQIGGLGVMTFTSFFAMFFMGQTSLYNQLVVRDMMNSNSLNTLLSTLTNILMFTIVIEGVGMVAIWSDIHGTMFMTLQEELAFSAFHAISAFCNSGISTLPGNLSNPLIFYGHIPFYLYVSVLVILGGIGFPILVNFKEILSFHFYRLWHFITTRHWDYKNHYYLFNLNTRIVLIVTVLLLVLGTGAFLWTEWNGALGSLSLPEKWTQAFFMAVCPRSAGFTSLNPAQWSVTTLLVFAVLMWIGGGSQSTAGGIKVNAFVVSVLDMWALLRGTERVEIFGRQLSPDSIRRSNATVIISLATISLSVFILHVLEPGVSLFGIFYECVAALSTAGVGLGITPELGTGGRVMITLLMFVGRVGLITLLMGVIRQKKHIRYSYPSGQIIIN